jgi:hypothetical protein
VFDVHALGNARKPQVHALGNARKPQVHVLGNARKPQVHALGNARKPCGETRASHAGKRAQAMRHSLWLKQIVGEVGQL